MTRTRLRKISAKIIHYKIISTQIDMARQMGCCAATFWAISYWQDKNSVLGLVHVSRTFLRFLLFFYFSKAAGGGREALYAVKKNQIPKKPPATLGGFFCTACQAEITLESSCVAQY
ncbi:hypothetical protein [Pollutimonas bauzanensis]|uniref:hypothetical protein n=1 Tax=Pollutimonas bauzanensis TaxID=658167 RepID=UPI0011607B71|nr:hypothetical protein [Pollutimonas bauzanensis]